MNEVRFIITETVHSNKAKQNMRNYKSLYGIR